MLGYSVSGESTRGSHALGVHLCQCGGCAWLQVCSASSQKPSVTLSKNIEKCQTFTIGKYSVVEYPCVKLGSNSILNLVYL